jgi:hypothetical protein
MDLLQQHFSTKAVAELLQHAPEVLSLPLSDWHQFLTSYGLTNEQLWKVFRWVTLTLRTLGSRHAVAQHLCKVQVAA